MAIKMYLGMVGMLLFTWAVGLLTGEYITDKVHVAIIGMGITFLWFVTLLLIAQEIKHV